MGVKKKLQEWAEDRSKRKYLIGAIGVAIVGVLLTFMPISNKESNTKSNIQITKTTTSSELTYETQMEKRLVSILQKMEGVGAVSVMVTTYSDEEKVLAEDVTQNNQHSEEKDQAGGTRNSVNTSSNHQVIMQSGNVPYVVKENKPEIKGVLILAEGADDSTVRSGITEAVSKVLDVPVHKISVLKKQS